MSSALVPTRQAAPKPPAPRRRASTRRARRVAVALAAAGAIVAVLLVITTGRAAPPALLAFRVPPAYHVTYAVSTPKLPTTAEQLWVRRPFDSIDITYADAPPGTTPTLKLGYRLGVQVLQAAGAQAAMLKVPAAAAPQDLRPDVTVPAALHNHRLRLLSAQVVAGRRCEVFRSAAPLRGRPLPTMRSQSSYVDTCIDADGIILRETQVSSGHVVLDRKAVAVQVGASAVDGAPLDLTGTPTPFDSGGGAFTALTFGSRPPGGSWALTHPPAGFTHVGRYAVVPPQPQLFGQGGQGTGAMGLPGALVTEMDDVFTRGSDVVVLQQGSTINGAPFTPPANGIAVDLGPLGSGQLLLAGNVTAVVAEPGNGKKFVRLSGTLPADALVTLMRSLTTQPAGTLTRLHSSASTGGTG
jgi:hypothetical protein